MNKPGTVERQEYMQKIVDATNACQLSSVFKADVLEAALRQLRELADKELKRDMEAWQAENKSDDEPQPFTGVVGMGNGPKPGGQEGGTCA